MAESAVANPRPSGDGDELVGQGSPRVAQATNPMQGSETSGSDLAPRTASLRKDALAAEMAVHGLEESLRKLPESRRFSLAVIQGANSGEIFQISKPQMIIGRTEGDIIVPDIEASRQHAQIEVFGERVVLRDLNSTNGTYVDEEKIGATNLENHSEFRIGSTIFMLIITDQD